MKRIRIAVALLALCCPTAAMAHPGHGQSGAGHYFTEPEHVVALGLIITLSIVSAVVVGRYVAEFAKNFGARASRRTQMDDCRS